MRVTILSINFISLGNERRILSKSKPVGSKSLSSNYDSSVRLLGYDDTPRTRYPICRIRQFRGGLETRYRTPLHTIGQFALSEIETDILVLDGHSSSILLWVGLETLRYSGDVIGC